MVIVVVVVVNTVVSLGFFPVAVCFCRLFSIWFWQDHLGKYLKMVVSHDCGFSERMGKEKSPQAVNCLEC